MGTVGLLKQYFKTTGQRIAISAFDLLSVYLALMGAFMLRFDYVIPPEQAILLKNTLPWLCVVQFAVLFAHGLNRGIWSFVGTRDLVLILRAVVVSQVFSVLTLSLSRHRLLGWPRSIFLLDAALLFLMLGGSRFSYRLLQERRSSKDKKDQKRILIIGAGQTGNLLSREFLSHSNQDVKLVGFLDDSSRLVGLKLQNAPILGKLSALKSVLKKKRPNEIIIAIPSLDGRRVREILTEANSQGISCRICPPIRDVLIGKVRLNQLRKVAVEDLLRRDVIKVDDSGLSAFLSGKNVLVTGAGGSIGSELCRQVLQYSPKKLTLFERSEFNLYRIQQELGNNAGVDFKIGDILDVRRLREIMETTQPHVVLHAAAYKHVPMMEENIVEAVKNNVVGTYNVANASADAGVEKFVLISTDKAVRPTSVMGATKRMAELVTNAISVERKVKTLAVRFGNVLDSEGSVLPLFRQQIANGGPITLTHSEVTRYFMTIPEATILVLQASLMGSGGQVFLLDMGEPVFIRQLAEELITLSGLRPYVDIDIITTGLRRGEKLYEELLVDFKTALRTTHNKIMVANNELDGNLPRNWKERIERFVVSPSVPSDSELLDWIRAWVPEYGSPEPLVETVSPVRASEHRDPDSDLIAASAPV